MSKQPLLGRIRGSLVKISFMRGIRKCWSPRPSRARAGSGPGTPFSLLPDAPSRGPSQRGRQDGSAPPGGPSKRGRQDRAALDDPSILTTPLDEPSVVMSGRPVRADPRRRQRATVRVRELRETPHRFPYAVAPPQKSVHLPGASPRVARAAVDVCDEHGWGRGGRLHGGGPVAHPAV